LADGWNIALTDEEWSLVAPFLPAPKVGGRPRKTNLRQVLNAVFYVVKTGCHWRALDDTNFGVPWETCYGYFQQWRRRGVLRKISDKLVRTVREKEGRRIRPSIAIVDSQSVKTGKMGGVRGYDGGKRVKGRKRHLLVDSLGLPLAVSVTRANVHDTKGGRIVLRKFIRNRSRYPTKLYADKGYQGPAFATWVQENVGAQVVIGRNLTAEAGRFIADTQRWVVERTFSWLYDYRRLHGVDHERKTYNSVAMITLALIRLMLRRATA
jgi:putative transposase